MFYRLSLSIIVWCIAASLAISPVFAQRGLKDIPPTDPEAERQSFEVAPGFEVTLFAAEPMLEKPIQMNFDAAGRLWVVCSKTYPQLKPGEVPDDRVVVLEDADGDGKADKSTTFAQGLLIPTGIEPGDGGLYVANSTELLHLKDTDGDGEADERRVILSGFGTEDTHHIIHTFRWGPDGALYFNQSIYIHSHVETPHGVRRLGGGGIWQFRPDSRELEVLCQGMWNSWGHQIDRYGQSFATDGAGSEGIHYILPGATYAGFPNTKKAFAGLNPRHPKYCGFEIVDGPHLPDDWQGDLITNDFRANRVVRFKLSDDGAGYTATQMPDVIRAKHVAFRPVDVKMGPDGAIYFADWYNPIIQHGEVDFRDQRRDHAHGRIWRLTAKGRPVSPRPKLLEASTAELCDQLHAPANWTRHFANRVLTERAKSGARAEVVAALAAHQKALAAAGEGAATPDLETKLLDTLFVYVAIDAFEPDLLKRLLRSPDGRVRAAATRLLVRWGKRLEDPLALLATQAADDHPRVRLEAIRTLAEFPSPRAMELAMSAMNRPLDRFTEHALWLTANDLAPIWMPAVKNGTSSLGDHPQQLEFALLAVGSAEVVPTLVSILNQPNLPAERSQKLLVLLGGVGGSGELARVYQAALDPARSPADRAALLAALSQAAAQRKAKPSGDVSTLLKLMDDPQETLRLEAIRLAAAWKHAPARPALTAIVTTPDSPPALRREAIIALASLGGDETRSTFDQLLAPQQPVAVRLQTVASLVAVDVQEAARRAVDVLAALKVEEGDPSDVFLALIRHKQGAKALAAALAGKKLPADVAKIGARVARGALQDPAPLVAALTAAGGLQTGLVALSAAEREKLLGLIAEKGQAARGEQIFRRTELACFKCHAIGGAGGQVGPDLTSIGAAAQLDYLLDSILEPNKAIKENFHSVVIETVDGLVLTGIKVKQDQKTLVIRDGEDRQTTIPLDAVETQSPGKSLMPVGLADTLTQAELVDLVRFMSELGKVGPFSIDRTPTARRWLTLQNNHEAHVASAAVISAVEAATDARLTWVPAYALVSGVVPVTSAPVVGLGEITGSGPARILRTEVDVNTAGAIGFELQSAPDARCYVDGQPIKLAAGVNGVLLAKLDLTPGVHAITIVVPSASKTSAFRLTLDEPSRARAQWVLGK